MSFFGKLFGGDQKQTTPPAAINSLPPKMQQNIELVSKLIDKKGLFAQRARVALCIDISGSMSTLYSNGSVQEVCERILPLGVKFDDNQAIDIFLFSDGSSCRDIGELTTNNFPNFVKDVVIKKHMDLMGGTDYAPVMKMIIDKYTKTKGDPAYVLFLTDGDNSDHSNAEKTIKEASSKGIFWQFVGIGGASFNFLKKLDTMSGRTIDNANFFSVDNISKMSDEELYEKMLAEFPSWLQEAKTKSII
jgi:hypothetical protein